MRENEKNNKWKKNETKFNLFVYILLSELMMKRKNEENEEHTKPKCQQDVQQMTSNTIIQTDNGAIYVLQWTYMANEVLGFSLLTHKFMPKVKMKKKNK